MSRDVHERLPNRPDLFWLGMSQFAQSGPRHDTTQPNPTPRPAAHLHTWLRPSFEGATFNMRRGNFNKQMSVVYVIA